MHKVKQKVFMSEAKALNMNTKLKSNYFFFPMAIPLGDEPVLSHVSEDVPSRFALEILLRLRSTQ